MRPASRRVLPKIPMGRDRLSCSTPAMKSVQQERLGVDRRLLGAARRRDLCTGGLGLRHGIGGAMVARRPGHRRDAGGDRAARGARERHRRRVFAGVYGPGCAYWDPTHVARSLGSPAEARRSISRAPRWKRWPIKATTSCGRWRAIRALRYANCASTAVPRSTIC